MRPQPPQFKNSELFEATFPTNSKYGGKLDTAAWHPLTETLNIYLGWAQERIDRIRKFQYPDMPQTYIDYFAYRHIQAGAKEISNRAIIGISGGAAGILFLVFRRMLADSRVMPDIGDTEIEATDLPVLTGEPTDLFGLASDLNAWAEPQDHMRTLTASLLIQTAFDFLVDHEYAHIAEGHSLLWHDLTGNPFVFELNWDASEGMSDLTAQAMEMSADANASDQGLTRLLWRVDHPEALADPFQFLYSDLEGSLYRWFFAVFTLFRLFGARPIDLDNLGKGDHPHYRIRQRLMFGNACKYLDFERPELVEIVPSVIHRAGIDVETAYSQITGTSVDFTDLRAVFEDSRVMDHIDELLIRRQDIAPMLGNLTRHRMPQV